MPLATILLSYAALILFVFSGIVLNELILANQKAEALARSMGDLLNAIDDELDEDSDFCVDSPEDVEEAFRLIRADEYGAGFEDGLSFAKSRLAGALDDIDPGFDGTICDQCIEDASVGDQADQGHDNDDSLDLALEEAGQRK